MTPSDDGLGGTFDLDDPNEVETEFWIIIGANYRPPGFGDAESDRLKDGGYLLALQDDNPDNHSRKV